MAISIRAVRFAAAAFVAAFLTGSARAETVNSSQWGFSATFPCQSKFSTQALSANLTLTSYDCRKDGRSYAIVFADLPAGVVTPESRESGYTSAVNSVARASRGMIRSAVPYPLGVVIGRDIVVDVQSKKKTIHARIFYIGDQQFHVEYYGPTGEETGTDCMDLLNSFAPLK
jgi:hypothetical protein